MFISDQTYLNWQKKLATNRVFRWFWDFWGIYITGLAVLAHGLLFFNNLRIIVILAWVAFLFGRFIICEIVYAFYKKPRPCQKLNFRPPMSKVFISWLNKRYDSFPSGHATSIAAISTVGFLFNPVLGILGFIAAFFNGVGRVILGYHYPEDILAGWVIGILSGLFVVLVIAPRLFT